MIAGILKMCLTTFLTERVVMCLMLKVVTHLAKRTTNTLDDEAVKIFQAAYDKKMNK